MWNDERNIILSKDPHIWELNKGIYKTFKDNHFIGFDYRKHRPKEFKGSEIPRAIKQDNNFISAIYYVGHIYDSIKENHVSLYLGVQDEIPELRKLESFICKEAAAAELNGELCIYCSIVLYFILQKSCKLCKDHLKYVQGLYRHKLRKDFPSFIPMSDWQQGLHAWVTIGESVIDLTIGQNDYFFDFGEEMPYVVGKVPEGMILIGHEELDSLAQKYKKKYARKANVSEELWLLYHQRAAAQMGLQMYQKMMQEPELDRLIKMAIEQAEKE